MMTLVFTVLGGLPGRGRTSRTSWNRSYPLALALALAFRVGCFLVMTFLAVINEGRPGRRLDDWFLELFPYLELVHRWNWWIWVVAWLPGSLLLWRLEPRIFLRFLVAGGLLSLLRGVCVLATGLGPVRGEDVHALREWTLALRLRATLEIADPVAVFRDGSATFWLTKDLFFSGHVASTFLLWLYCRRRPLLARGVLLLHLGVLASVFFGHLHYTIDVLGGYLAALAVHAGVERFLDRRPALAPPPRGGMG
jgi:hypothetical protein